MPKNTNIHNNMLDIVVIIVCSLCGFAIGKYVERRVKAKSDFLSDLVRYTELFRLNIDGRQVELDKFNKEFAENCSVAFREYLTDGKIRCGLSNAEKTSLKNFYDNIGAVGSRELKSHIDYYSAIFSSQNKSATEQASKASVYVKLGILLGVMVGIVLI